MAYSLFLFMRDVADDDFVGWIDRQLGAVGPHAPDTSQRVRPGVVTLAETTKIFPLSPRELHRMNSASTGNCFKTIGSAEDVTSMTLKHSGPNSWARKRTFLEPYCLRASPSPPLPAPLSVECPTSSKFIRSGMVGLQRIARP